MLPSGGTLNPYPRPLFDGRATEGAVAVGVVTLPALAVLLVLNYVPSRDRAAMLMGPAVAVIVLHVVVASHP
jgi:hypothetical protein